MTRDRVDIQRVESKDPDLVASLRVMPPLKYPDADPESYKAKERSEWTLGNLERTCIELRAAGGWDDSLVKIGYRDGGSIECEILAGPGPDVLPWGWVPAHGAPPTRPSVVIPNANRWARNRRKHAPGCRFYRSALSRLLSLIAAVVTWEKR